MPERGKGTGNAQCERTSRAGSREWGKLEQPPTLVQAASAGKRINRTGLGVLSKVLCV